MNCKQGDLAVIVGGGGPANSVNRGKFVTIGKFLGHVNGWAGSDRWEVDVDVVGTFGTLYRHVRDCYLRPIRDPGEDARDETLQWLPVPSKEEVSA